jgi:hypothetical protein
MTAGRENTKYKVDASPATPPITIIGSNAKLKSPMISVPFFE